MCCLYLLPSSGQQILTRPSHLSLSLYSEHILHDSDVFKTPRLQSYEKNYNERYCPVVPGFAPESKVVWREIGVIFIVILQTIEICFVDIFGATKVKYSRFVSDCLLMFLCYLKWESDYRDEELFPGVDSEIPDKILKSLQASRDKGKRWKVLFDIVSILPHYYVQEALCMIMPQSEMICLNSVNLRWLRLLYIIGLPKLFETLDHLLQGEFLHCAAYDGTVDIHISGDFLYCSTVV